MVACRCIWNADDYLLRALNMLTDGDIYIIVVTFNVFAMVNTRTEGSVISKGCVITQRHCQLYAWNFLVAQLDTTCLPIKSKGDGTVDGA